MTKQKPPDELMLADLARSGLDAADARRMGVEALTADEVRAITKDQLKQPAYRVPYLKVDGTALGYFRLRKLDVPGSGGAFDGKKDKKDFRYWQPKGSAPRAYFPPNRPWSKVIKDVEQVILITEGEKKSFRGAKDGLNVIGLGGDWSFRSKKRSWLLLPELAAIIWEGREVWIVFDSDADGNEQVEAAERVLAQELMRRGATVKIIRLTSASNGDKRGLDDFLEQQDLAAFNKLAADAPLATSRFAALDRDFIVVESQAQILQLKTGYIYNYGNFKNVIGSKYSEHVLTKDGEKDIDVVKPWLASETRNECSDMVYEPGQPFPDLMINGARFYNRWKGLALEPQAGDVTPFLDVVDYVFTGAKASEREWFLDWLAYQVQNPGKKLLTAVVLTGQSGIGKSIIGQVFGAIFGANYNSIDNTTLHSPYTGDWLADKQFILADEISAPDRRADADRIKNLITQQENTINAKYGAKFRQRNCANYLLTSNHPDPLLITADERRFFIHASQANLRDDAQQRAQHVPRIARFIKWRDEQNGSARWFRFLLDRKIAASFDPGAPAPATSGKATVVAMGKSSLEVFADEVMADPKRRLNSDVALWEMRQLATKYDGGSSYRDIEKALSLALANAGALHTPKTRTKFGLKNLWCVKNIERWRTAQGWERAREFERHGPMYKFQKNEKDTNAAAATGNVIRPDFGSKDLN